MKTESQAPSAGDCAPWGPWATAGLSLLTILVFSVAGTGALIVITILLPSETSDLSLGQLIDIIESDDLKLSVSIIISQCIGILLVLVFIKMKKVMTIRKYLNFYAILPKVLLDWIIVSIILSICLIVIIYLSGISIVPAYLTKETSTVYLILLSILFTVFLAPIFEEILFRGFLFVGIMQSKLGENGALVITALAWSVVHFPLDVFQFARLMILGFVFGVARLQTNSLYVPVAMHMATNVIAIVSEVVLT